MNEETIQESRETDIFSHVFHGKRYFYDPIVLFQRQKKASADIELEVEHAKLAGPDWFHDQKLREAAPPEQIKQVLDRIDEATEALAPVMYAMFNQKPLNEEDGTGVTIGSILNAYTSFIWFSSDVKKNTDQNQNSEQHTPESTSNHLQESNVLASG